MKISILTVAAILFASPTFAQYIPPSGGGGGSSLCSGSVSGASSSFVLTATNGGNPPACAWESTGGASVTEAAVNNSEWLTSVAGTNTITGSTTTSYASYASGFTLRLVPANTNTGAVTINVNSIGAKAVTKNGTTALAGGEMITGHAYFLMYDGTEFQLTAVFTNGTNNQFLTSNGTGEFGTALANPLPRTNGGLNSNSAGTGILRDGTTPAASELSGDVTTSGSNAVTVVKINGTLLSGLATLLAQTMSVYTIPEIAGDGNTHVITPSDTARLIQFIAPAGNTNVVRIGDSTTTSSKGLPLAPGSGFTLPIPPLQIMWGTATIYYNVQSGDKLDIMYAR